MADGDCSYWDPEIQPEKYSFAGFAIAEGYSVFFYDRLGISKSSVHDSQLSKIRLGTDISPVYPDIYRKSRTK